MRYVICTIFCIGLFSALVAQNNNINIIANLDEYSGTGYTDCWGYTAPDGSEYALLGVNAGVSIVNVTDPGNITEVDFIPFVNFGWYDMKTYQHYMYVSSEGADHILIVDLSPLPDSTSVVGTSGSFATDLHNIFIDTSAAVLYAIEDFNFNRPVTLLSLNDPGNPVEIAFLGSGLGTDAHDVFVRDSVLYVAEGINGTIGFFDVSDPANPALLQRLSIPSPGYVHNVWVSEDKKYMITTEETPGKTVKIWDIEDLNSINLIDEYLGESQLAHNAFLKGDYAYISHYQSGVKVLDISDPANVIEVGNYDTITGEEPITFGNWGVYPFTQSGLIFISDMQSGLYVGEFNYTQAYRIDGTLKDAQTGQPIDNGWVEVLQTELVERTGSDGRFKTGFPGSGSLTLLSTALGYEVKETPITAVAGQTDTIDILLQPIPAGSITGTITNDQNMPLEGIPVTLTVISPLLSGPEELQTTTNSAGEYTFNELPPGDTVWVEYSELKVEQSLPYPAKAVGDITVSAGSPTVIDFQLRPADLFLVNDDPGAAYTDLYEESLTSLGITPFKWVTSVDGEDIPVSSFDLLANKVLIWFTGDADSMVLTSVEQDSLNRFLDTGGRLLLTGRNIAQNLSAQGSGFLQSYLQVDYAGTPAGPPLVNPVPGNPVTGGLGSFSNSQTSRDALMPVPGSSADSAFTYFQGDLAGVTLDNAVNNSQTVFLGFGIEGISVGDTRQALLAEVLNWFDVSTGVNPAAPSSAPQAFELRQNYPNPFNPSTFIEYTLPRQANVTLKIYNILGQEIRTLVKGEKSAGAYREQWDGKDNRGYPVATGVYIYRLEAGELVRTRKMILLR